MRTSSKISCARAMSKFSSLCLSQGRLVSQSRYVRVTLYSLEFFSRLLSFSISSSMTFLACSGTSTPSNCPPEHRHMDEQPAGMGERNARRRTRSRNFCSSASLSSFSKPSSFLMLFSCSCRKYWRWFFAIFSSTCLEMSCCSLLDTSSCLRSISAPFSRSTIVVASSTFCSSSPSAVVRAAEKSACRHSLGTSAHWARRHQAAGSTHAPACTHPGRPGAV